MKLTLTLMLMGAMLLSVGCASLKTAPAHPNQLNAFDGDTHDALTTAQGVLTEAKAQYAAGKLPTSAKVVINDAGKAYNTATVAWLGYRDIVTGKTPGNAATAQAQVQSSVDALNTQVSSLKSLVGGK